MKNPEVQIQQPKVSALLERLIQYGMNLMSYNDNIATVNYTDNPNEMATGTTGLAIVPQGTNPDGTTRYLGYDVVKKDFRELTDTDIEKGQEALGLWLEFNELTPLHSHGAYDVPQRITTAAFHSYSDLTRLEKDAFQNWLDNDKKGINHYLEDYRGKSYDKSTMQDNSNDHLIQALDIDPDGQAIMFQIPAFRMKDGEFNHQVLNYPITNRDYINPYGDDYDPACPPNCLDYEDAVIDDGDDRYVKFLMKFTSRRTKFDNQLQFGDVYAVGDGDWHIYLPE